MEGLGEPDNGPWDQLAAADAIVFGAPTYMGSASAPFKQFADASSKVWFTQGSKDKLSAGFTNSGSWSGDKLNTLIQFATLAAQHGMNWVNLGMMPGFNKKGSTAEDLNRVGSYLGLMAQSNVDEGPDTAPVASDRKTAGTLGRRVAEAAVRWRQREIAWGARGALSSPANLFLSSFKATSFSKAKQGGQLMSTGKGQQQTYAGEEIEARLEIGASTLAIPR